MYIAPGQGQTAPRGQNFDVNRKALSLYPFAASFKEISLKSDFMQFLSSGTSCHFGHLLQVKKKTSLKSDFIHFFS